MSSPIEVEYILSPSTKATPKAPQPHRALTGDTKLSVFDILNIFCCQWFLSRSHLMANAISSQKTEDGNISWVEFSPHFHSHLVKCAVALVPHPVCKVKKVMFAFILELLNKEDHLAFFLSKRVVTWPTMPRERRDVLHGNGAMLLSRNGTGRQPRQPNFPPVRGNAQDADASSSPAKPPTSTSAPIPKWSTPLGKQVVSRAYNPCHHHSQPSWLPQSPHVHPLPHQTVTSCPW